MSADDLLNLKNELDRHEAELDVHLGLLKAIEEDLEIVIRFADPNVVLQANQYATTNPSADPVLKKRNALSSLTGTGI
jgi:hypothetical protein